jgi:hypothetical protein
VARGHDPRGAVDAHSVIAALVGDVGLTGVHAHADAELGPFRPRVGGERALPVGRGRRRIARASEDVEERVSLRVDLLAAVSGERLTQKTLMLCEQVAVAVAEQFHQPRRSLHVGEEKGDRAPVPLRHALLVRADQDGRVKRYSGLWHTASMLFPSGSWTYAA